MIRSFTFPAFLTVLSIWSVSCTSLVAPMPDLDERDDMVVVDDSTASAQGGVDPDASDALPAPVYAKREGARVHGYYAWWTRGLWLDLDLSLYDKLFFFEITPAADGSIRDRNGYPFAWQGLIARADSANVPVIPTMTLLDADSLQALFLNPHHRDTLLSSSLELIEESGGKGLHLDFEWFAPAEDSLREGFHAYVDTLAARVASDYPDAELSMFVPAFHPDGMIDLTRIPAFFSEIMVQGYDLHWQTGPTAGPVAPLSGWNGNNWESILHAMDTLGMDRQRLLITVPYYGYEWPVTGQEPGSATRGEARVVTNARLDSLNVPEMQVAARDRAREHGLQRDASSGSPFYTYEDSTGWYQGWFEDPESLSAKYRFVMDSDLAGVAIFPIGYDASGMDGVLRAAFGSRRVN